MDRGIVNQALAEEVRERRRRAGLTGEALQTLLKWKTSTFKRTEQASRRPYFDEIFELAHALRVEPDELVAMVYQRTLSTSRPPPGPGAEWRGAFGLD